MKTTNQAISEKEEYKALRNEIIALEVENNLLRNLMGLNPRKPKISEGKCIKIDFTKKESR